MYNFEHAFIRFVMIDIFFIMSYKFACDIKGYNFNNILC